MWHHFCIKIHSPGFHQRHRSQYERQQTRSHTSVCLDLFVHRALETAYHSDGSSKGSLVGKGVQRLKAGKLSELTGIRAQRPGSKRRQHDASCGGGSGRIGQSGHRAHRGSGGSGIHCVTIGFVAVPKRVYKGSHQASEASMGSEIENWSPLKESVKFEIRSTLRVHSRNFPVSAGPKGTGCSAVRLVIFGNI